LIGTWNKKEEERRRRKKEERKKKTSLVTIECLRSTKTQLWASIDFKELTNCLYVYGVGKWKQLFVSSFLPGFYV